MANIKIRQAEDFARRVRQMMGNGVGGTQSHIQNINKIQHNDRLSDAAKRNRISYFMNQIRNNAVKMQNLIRIGYAAVTGDLQRRHQTESDARALTAAKINLVNLSKQVNTQKTMALAPSTPKVDPILASMPSVPKEEPGIPSMPSVPKDQPVVDRDQIDSVVRAMRIAKNASATNPSLWQQVAHDYFNFFARANKTTPLRVAKAVRDDLIDQNPLLNQSRGRRR